MYTGREKPKTTVSQQGEDVILQEQEEKPASSS
jgi:hypothetical protein